MTGALRLTFASGITQPRAPPTVIPDAEGIMAPFSNSFDGPPVTLIFSLNVIFVSFVPLFLLHYLKLYLYISHPFLFFSSLPPLLYSFLFLRFINYSFAFFPLPFLLPPLTLL